MTVAEENSRLPKHVAIIMDGNNRFAKKNQMQKGDAVSYTHLTLPTKRIV